MSLGEAFEEVLAAAKLGGEWAWARLFREYAGAVTGYLRSKGAASPEDVASEVFIQVATNIGTFEGDESSFRSWVFVIAHRRLIDDLRARKRRPSVTELPDDCAGSIRGPADIEGEVVERMTTDEIVSLFDKLSDVQREVVTLRIIAGLTLNETARVLDSTVGAVKAAQHRAVQTLLSLVQQEHVTK